MNNSVSLSATPTTHPAQNAQAERSIALWVFVLALMVVAVAVLMADASLTPEQRIAVFMQAGHFP